MSESAERPQLKIYRASEAPSLMEAGCMTMESMSDVQKAGISQAVEAGYLEGDEIKVLTDMPGFCVIHAWLKRDYPLMRHTHDADCMYYIVAGSIKFGTEELGPRDCFFVPSGVPYTYTPGPDGVEILEFRHKPSFNFVNLSHGERYWEKAVETCAANRDAWKEAVPPTQK